MKIIVAINEVCDCGEPFRVVATTSFWGKPQLEVTCKGCGQGEIMPISKTTALITTLKALDKHGIVFDK